MKFPIDKCPHCGCTVFRMYTRLNCLVAFDVNADGIEADNSYMYDDVFGKDFRWWVCANCEKRLFKDSEVKK